MKVYTVLARDITSPTDIWVHATYDNFEAAEECVKDMNSLSKSSEFWVACPLGTELLMF